MGHTGHNEGFYTRVVRELTIGLGESYMDGWWDCQNLDQFFYHILSSHLDEKVKRNPSIILSHLQVASSTFNPESV